MKRATIVILILIGIFLLWTIAAHRRNALPPTSGNPTTNPTTTVAQPSGTSPIAGYADIVSSPLALRPQWSSDGQWIVYDDHQAGFLYIRNSYKIYRVHPDGTGTECLTCDRSEVPGNSGGAQIDPSGRYVAFSAEQANHYPLKGSGADPGGGIFNDLAILDL